MPTRWRILAVLFLARTTMAIQFESVAALAPVVMRDFDAGLSDMGLLIGLYLAPASSSPIRAVPSAPASATGTSSPPAWS
jgi:hypothetical protein